MLPEKKEKKNNHKNWKISFRSTLLMGWKFFVNWLRFSLLVLDSFLLVVFFYCIFTGACKCCKLGRCVGAADIFFAKWMPPCMVGTLVFHNGWISGLGLLVAQKHHRTTHKNWKSKTIFLKLAPCSIAAGWWQADTDFFLFFCRVPDDVKKNSVGDGWRNEEVKKWNGISSQMNGTNKWCWTKID